jgi:hypothetical protein
MGKYTVKTASEFFDKSEYTIRRWIEEGKLDAEKDPGGHGWIIFIDENKYKKNRRRMISQGVKL